MATKRILVLLSALAVLVVGCGGSSSGPAPEPTKSSPTANQLWVQHHAGTGGGHAVAQSVVVGPDGARIFVTGSTGTVAYAADNGSQLWFVPTTSFLGSGGSTTAPTAAVNPDGTRLFVTGTSGGDYLTLAYDTADGERLWTARYDGPATGADDARAVAVSPDGSTVFVNGTSEGKRSGQDFATIAYRASTGARVWLARYDGPAGGDDSLFPGAVQSLVVNGNGKTVYVTGASRRAGSARHDYATVAYVASTGARRWVSRYAAGATSDNLATSVAVTGDYRTVVVTGSSGTKGGTGFDVATVGYDVATGTQRWVKRYNSSASHNEGAVDIAASPTGDKVFVTGVSEGRTVGHESFLTLAYDASAGKSLWVDRYATAAGDSNAAAVAVSPDGARVYVTGWSDAGQRHAFATVAYDATSGARLWVGQYAGSAGYAESRSVAVGPDGTVFVTGEADGYATVAYRR